MESHDSESPDSQLRIANSVPLTGQRTEHVKTGHVKTDRFRGHFRGRFRGHPRGTFRGDFRGEVLDGLKQGNERSWALSWAPSWALSWALSWAHSWTHSWGQISQFACSVLVRLRQGEQIRERPPRLIQHVLTVLVFWSLVLLQPRLPPSSRSLRLVLYPSILLHGPLDVCLDLLPAAPLPPVQKRDAQHKFLQHRGARADKNPSFGSPDLPKNFLSKQ